VIRSVVGAPFGAVRRSTFWWSIGLAALVAVTIAFWPVFRGSSGVSEAIDQLPGAVVQAFGLENFGTPAGFLRGNLYEFLVPLLMAIAAVALVNGQTASDEINGRLELFLAQPVDRRLLFLGRAAAALLAVAIITLITLAVQFGSSALFGLVIDSSLVTSTIVLCGLLAALHGAFAFALAAATARPSAVLGLGIGVAIVGYLLVALFPLSDVLEPLSHLSPWDWAFGGDPLVEPTETWRYLALAMPTLVLLAVGTIVVVHRDIASA